MLQSEKYNMHKCRTGGQLGLLRCGQVEFPHGICSFLMARKPVSQFVGLGLGQVFSGVVPWDVGFLDALVVDGQFATPHAFK